MEWLFQMENLRLRQDKESERLFKKKKKKDSERRETLPLPTPWVKLPKREVRAWNLAATHGVTLPPRESDETHLANPRNTHPPRDTHLAVTLLLALICSSLHTQLTHVFNLFFKISESVLVLFFLALWLCLWIVNLCLWVLKPNHSHNLNICSPVL